MGRDWYEFVDEANKGEGAHAYSRLQSYTDLEWDPRQYSRNNPIRMVRAVLLERTKQGETGAALLSAMVDAENKIMRCRECSSSFAKVGNFAKLEKNRPLKVLGSIIVATR